MLKTSIYLVSLFCIVACGDSRERVPADTPGYVNGKAVHPTIKIGRPYRVKGVKYYPEYDPDYDEEGMASWYGPNFHGKSTANGERYNQWAMTAAHKTLPLPSMVRVTHGKTGKSILVRVNDRGPFASGRIIDLSRAAAEELGMIGEGVAPVRVEYLKPETEQYIAKLQLKKPKDWTAKDIEIAKAEQREAQIVDAAPVQAVETASLHAIEPASQVPERFAFNAPIKESSTLDERGVVLEEIGYAQDAFSVLDESAYKAPPPVVTPFKRVSYVPQASAQTMQDSVPEPVLGAKAYYVQAGTFGDQANAYKLAERLQSLSAIDVVTTNAGGKTLYRVRLGPTANQQTAQHLQEALKEYHINDATIVKE